MADGIYGIVRNDDRPLQQITMASLLTQIPMRSPAGLEVKGATEQGMMVYLKHFALNDQETNRTNGICTWASEQTIREIYLKAFESAFKDGKATNAVRMSSDSTPGGNGT